MPFDKDPMLEIFKLKLLGITLRTYFPTTRYI